MTTPALLNAIFRPRSVGVVGVSRNSAKLGNRVLANIRQRGFAGSIVAIGNADHACGLQVVRSIDALDAAPELIFAAVPAAASPDLIRQGVPWRLIGSSSWRSKRHECGAADRG